MAGTIPKRCTGLMLRLASLNIETDKHFHRFVPFLRAMSPDVVTLQEVPEHMLRQLGEDIGCPNTAFAPFTEVMARAGPMVIGVAILSRWALVGVGAHHYAGGSDGRVRHDLTSLATMAATTQNVLLSADVLAPAGAFRVVTTHFPWSPMGLADDIQRDACTRLLAALPTLGEFVLTGDFNAPRGREIFERIAGVLNDTIPAHVETSIDGNLHRAGALKLMVDGLFTTSAFVAHDVTMHSGLSDHLGITATLLRRERDRGMGNFDEASGRA